MSFTFKTTAELKFKNIAPEFVKGYLQELKYVEQRFDKRIAIQVDIASLSQDEKEIMFDGGNFTPNYFLYWSKLIFEIQKIVTSKEYSAFWIDSTNKKYYDETTSTTLELMTDNLRWENNSPNLFYAWGKLNQGHIFKEPLNCNGIVMPCIEGWGLIALLNNDDYDLLKSFFPPPIA